MAERVFSQQQLRRMGRPQAVAEDIIADHYRISSFGPGRYSYEVATHRDLAVGERSTEKILAEVRRYDAVASARWEGTPTHLYRIFLHDPNILTCCDRHCNVPLESLLVYVFVHELVHVVHFDAFLHPLDCSQHQRWQKEREVYDTTHFLLRRCSLPGMETILMEIGHGPSSP